MSQVGDPDFYPTQKPQSADIATITAAETDLGAPTGPVPPEFLSVPPYMDICQAFPSEADLTAAADLRGGFVPAGYPAPSLDDILRAFD